MTGINELLEHNSSELPINQHDCVIMRTPHPIFVHVLQNMKAGSQGKDSSRCNPLTFNDRLYEYHAERISNAFDLLRERWDRFVWAEELVHESTHNQVHALLNLRSVSHRG